MSEDWREKKCHDCGCKHGEFHEPGCDMERCPFCLGQLITCDCCYERLGYEPGFLPDEIFNEGLGEEDSKKWDALLKEKGLIPYQSPWQPGVAENIWWEFLHPDGHCSLCGNHGRVSDGGYCICPNGRAMRRGSGESEWPHPGVDDVWEEFKRDDGLCALCDDSGVIDTRGEAMTPAGWRVGAKSYCFCPRGRRTKQVAGRERWHAHPNGHSLIAHVVNVALVILPKGEEPT
jgi:hypothetical protein